MALTILERGKCREMQLLGLADKKPVPSKRIRMLNGVARTHVNKPTKAEKRMLWHLNCLGRMCDRKIRYVRERSVHLADSIGRVVDIYFPKQRLGIEIDGKQHAKLDAAAWDAWRDQLLAEHQVTIMRITNERVFDDLNGVMLEIMDTLLTRRRMGRRAEAVLRSNLKQIRIHGITWEALANGYHKDHVLAKHKAKD
jgi:very-short-patch-repair endonuclease